MGSGPAWGAAARPSTAASASARTARCWRRGRSYGRFARESGRDRAGQPGDPRQRHLRLRLRVRPAVRHQLSGDLLLQGHHEGTPFRQPHPPDRGVPRRDAQRRGAAEPRRGQGAVRGAAQIEGVLPQAGDGECQRLFRGRIRLHLCAAGQGGAGGVAGGQYLLPQRTQRRYELRRVRGGRGGGHKGREGGDHQAGLYEAQPQCHRHRRHRKSLSGRGGGRHQPD